MNASQCEVVVSSGAEPTETPAASPRWEGNRETVVGNLPVGGVGASTVSTQLGHSTGGFTFSTYFHPDLSSQERAAAALEGLLS